MTVTQSQSARTFSAPCAWAVLPGGKNRSAWQLPTEQRAMSVTSGLSAALPLTRGCACGASLGGQTCQGSGVRQVPVCFLPMGLLAGQEDAVRCPQVLMSLLAMCGTAWSPARLGGVVGEPQTLHSCTGKDSEPDSMDGVPTSLTFSAHLKHELSHCFDFPGLILECPGSWGP